jgi:hypothetical protein
MGCKINNGWNSFRLKLFLPWVLKENVRLLCWPSRHFKGLRPCFCHGFANYARLLTYKTGWLYCEFCKQFKTGPLYTKLAWLESMYFTFMILSRSYTQLNEQFFMSDAFMSQNNTNNETRLMSHEYVYYLTSPSGFGLLGHVQRCQLIRQEGFRNCYLCRLQ